MIYYLVIGVRRDPGEDEMDCGSFRPATLNFSSEKELTCEEIEKAFRVNIEEEWSILFEYLDDDVLNDSEEGYQNVDYIFRSVNPFPEFEIFSHDLCNEYLGS